MPGTNPWAIIATETSRDRVHHTLKCGVELWGFGPFARLYGQFGPGQLVHLEGASLRPDHSQVN